MARRLAVNGIDRAYSSPLGRAKLTAKPLCDLLGLECNIEPWAVKPLHGKVLLASCQMPLQLGFFLQNTALRNDNTVYVSEKWYEIESLDILKAELKRDMTS